MLLPLFPRVEQQDSGRLEIGNVPRHDMKTVAPRRGGNQPIARWQRSPLALGYSRQFPPNAAGFEIDWEQPVGIKNFQGLQPGLQRSLLLALLEKRDPFCDFADGWHTHNKDNAVKLVNTQPT